MCVSLSSAKTPVRVTSRRTPLCWRVAIFSGGIDAKLGWSHLFWAQSLQVLNTTDYFARRGVFLSRVLECVFLLAAFFAALVRFFNSSTEYIDPRHFFAPQLQAAGSSSPS